MRAKRAESVCLAVIVDTNSILSPRRTRRRHRPYAATVDRNVQKVRCHHFAYVLGIIHVLRSNHIFSIFDCSRPFLTTVNHTPAM